MLCVALMRGRATHTHAHTHSLFHLRSRGAGELLIHIIDKYFEEKGKS